jgi:hypothetical protein
VSGEPGTEHIPAPIIGAYLFTGDLTSRGERERNRGCERGGRGEVGPGESTGTTREGSG